MKYHYNPPGIIKKMFGSFAWDSACGKILLTFDDGPNESTTGAILNLLSEKGLKGVFFCVGANVKKHPELVKKILAGGHVIANHTFNHKKLTELSFMESIHETNSFTLLMKDEFGYDVEYFRPPHGKFKPGTASLIKKCGLKNVMWSLLTYDYKNDMKVVKFAVEKYLRNDSIVVMHDSVKSEKIIGDTINLVVETALKRGYEIGEPQECLR